MTSGDVAVVIGAGGIGAACARRLATTHPTLLVADFDLERAADVVSGLGLPAGLACQVDVSDRGSVRALARSAASAGAVSTVVHTAGVSPTQASVQSIVLVDLVGTALVLDEFAHVIAPGGSGVVVASLAGHIFGPNLTHDQERELADTSTADLATIGLFVGLEDKATAYGYAKRGNHLRVRSAAKVWGGKAARINSVSPGVVDTEMGRSEQAGPDAAMVEFLIENSPLRRPAHPDEIAEVVGFLTSRSARFITGTDVLVDGGALPVLA